MKYALTGPKGRIFQVSDTSPQGAAPERIKEITDEQAIIVSSKADPLGYFVIDGAFINGTEAIAILAEQRFQETATAEQKMSRAAYLAAAAIFESMSLGKQAIWEGVRMKVAAAITDGDFLKAKTIIETVPFLYEGMEEDRAMFLALFA